MVRVAVAGSSGSIGTQTLSVVRAEPDRYEIVALGVGASSRPSDVDAVNLETMAAAAAAEPGGSSVRKQNLYGGHEEAWWRGRYADVRNEIKRIQDALPAKNDELEKLHRKWVISKGRKPGEGETRDDRFVKPPPGEGELSHALSNPGRYRSAYYEKKSDIEKDETRIKELQENLNNLEVEAGKAGVPMEWR